MDDLQTSRTVVTSMVVRLAHDFICPWCWVGLSQAKRLKQDFGVEIEWLGYEIFPEELEWPERGSSPAVESARPPTPTRMDLAYAAEGMEPPTAVRPKRMRIHNAHEAMEYAKLEGVADELAERLYNAYWLEGKEINNPAVMAELAEGIVKNIPEMLKAIEEKRFKDNIIGFDEPAYATGIYNVPTFIVDGEKFAEQPYSVIRKAKAFEPVHV